LPVETGISGLKIKVNKVVMDKRGVLCELSAGENDNFLASGVKNIYASIATGKHTARAGHFHFKNVENFYTLSGTALWFFKDCRKGSPTHGKEFKIILGFDKPNVSTKTPFLTIDNSQMAQVLVPSGVYHIFWPLTEAPVTVLAIASEPYDKDDYARPDSEIPTIDKILKEVV